MSKRLTQTQQHFAEAVHADIKRSTFLRNSTLKTTFNCGQLVPVYIDEVLPGDTFEMDMAHVARMSTPIFPTMDTLNLEFFAFFVPNRLVMDRWERVMGTNTIGVWKPTGSPTLVPYFINSTSVFEQTEKTIGDYYGIPVGMDYRKTSLQPNALPFRGYGLIWNEWFRNQNYESPISIVKTTTNETITASAYAPNMPLLSVNKPFDYFTSVLPAPQKGESALIPIELNELIPVITGERHSVVGNNAALNFIRTGGTVLPTPGPLFADNGLKIQEGGTIPTSGTINSLQPDNLWADGTSMQLSASTISELRSAFQIQKLYEKDARGGTRYVEMLKAHFGVDAQDYRLQRPEFLGKAKHDIIIHQVEQTSATTEDTSPQGNLASFAYSSGKKILFKKSFVEHGFVHIFAVARQPKTYQNGLAKFWSRRERFDYYFPTLAHISEQPILNKEIFCVTGTNDDLNGIFGYNEAWADYRYKPNMVTGQFRSDATNTLDNWHYADKYDAMPVASASWFKDNSKINVDRTLAVQSSLHDQIIIDIAFLNKTTRPMPLHSIPGMVDHF